MAPPIIMVPRKNRLDSLSARRVMHLCLMVSSAVHLFLVIVFKNAFPLYWPDTELRTYRVELIRPPVEGLEKADLSDGELKKLLNPPPDSDEDTISLNTEDERYVTYARVIKKRILRRWHYPIEAKENLIEGRLLLLFRLNRNGHLIGLRVLESSGHQILDREAQRAVKAASPFPPFPSHVRVSRLNIKANFDYRIASHRPQK
ncbi:MAG: TonB family protein [Deltaproteobacteria bacterium]|nr:TonB family protein [Deltaproteobacteria bacterium]MBW2128113.1 TonB family protein [Deltaproteobacteria bacterium]